ncbi:MAG: UDP-2,3-diacylglucosamine diphosphatase [Oligoflexales bacterium]
MEKIRDSVVVVSDVHLTEVYDSRGQMLLDLIANLDQDKVEYFVLLGDIFDFCFGASRYFKKKFAAFGEALSGLANAGIKVVFLQGNHEFSLDELAWEGVEFVLKRDYQIKLGTGLSLSLTHGDRLGAPWHYKIYLAITRSYWFRCAGLLCPQSLLDKLCLKISIRSRAKSSKSKIPHKKILQNMQRWLAKLETVHGIIGHFHIPYQENHGNKGKILGLCSWDQPNALGFDGQNFKRYYFKGPGCPYLTRKVRAAANTRC